MIEVYRAAKISKQGFYANMMRQTRMREEQENLLGLIKQWRIEHPGMGVREIYFHLRPKCMGRDLFEDFCFERGLRVIKQRSFIRTTNSYGVTRFPNLIEDLELTHVNQVWVSDITYYQIGHYCYYLTFIMDLFSRYIVGYSISEDLLTIHTTIPALKCAIKNRKDIPAGLILHSDGGGQYYCKQFLQITMQYQIKNSMAEEVYENSNAERVNGTIKNYYLKGYNPLSFTELIACTRKAVERYNLIKFHQAFNRLSPDQFEKLSPENQLINKEKRTKKEKSTISNNFR